jgi:hypothetical protein
MFQLKYRFDLRFRASIHLLPPAHVSTIFRLLLIPSILETTLLASADNLDLVKGIQTYINRAIPTSLQVSVGISLLSNESHNAIRLIRMAVQALIVRSTSLNLNFGY